MSNEEKIIAMLSELKADMDGVRYDVVRMKAELSSLRQYSGGLSCSGEQDIEPLGKMRTLMTKEKSDDALNPAGRPKMSELEAVKMMGNILTQEEKDALAVAMEEIEKSKVAV